jgi:hypothetical protein
MAETIFIALSNMKYWLQDQWKSCTAGDALSISHQLILQGLCHTSQFGDKSSIKKRLIVYHFRKMY